MVDSKTVGVLKEKSSSWNPWEGGGHLDTLICKVYDMYSLRGRRNEIKKYVTPNKLGRGH